MFLLSILNIFLLFFTVISIIDFEQLNFSWVWKNWKLYFSYALSAEFLLIRQIHVQSQKKARLNCYVCRTLGWYQWQRSVVLILHFNLFIWCLCHGSWKWFWLRTFFLSFRIYDLQFFDETIRIEAHESEILCVEFSSPQSG